MRVGTFCMVKNEQPWIRAHLLSWLPWIDEMILFDGNSTDGTLNIVKDIRSSHPFGGRIKLFENKDCNDLQDHYVSVFDECLHSLSTDYAIYAHPDMILDDPGNIRDLGTYHAYTTSLRSFAGNPGEQVYEIKGRGVRWKNVYRLNNPDLGLHYFGHYGAWNEDCYFREITGKEHIFHGQEFYRYPYRIGDSWIKILHYSDVRTYDRRFSRMVSCLMNNGHTRQKAEEIAKNHPRVALKSDQELTFIPAEYHPLFKENISA